MNGRVMQALNKVAKSNDPEPIKRAKGAKLLIQSVWRATV